VKHRGLLRSNKCWSLYTASSSAEHNPLQQLNQHDIRSFISSTQQHESSSHKPLTHITSTHATVNSDNDNYGTNGSFYFATGLVCPLHIWLIEVFCRRAFGLSVFLIQLLVPVLTLIRFMLQIHNMYQALHKHLWHNNSWIMANSRLKEMVNLTKSDVLAKTIIDNLKHMHNVPMCQQWTVTAVPAFNTIYAATDAAPYKT